MIGTQHVFATKLSILIPKWFFVKNVRNMSLRLHLRNIINLQNSDLNLNLNLKNIQISINE